MWTSWRIHESGPFRGRLFDPATLTVASLASTAIGGGISAAGTIAGGNAAAQAGQMQQQAANYQAAQTEENARQSFASGQRQMLDTEEKTRLAISSARAAGASSGVDIGTGSPADVQGQLAKRGSYNAAMDMFNGASAASGLMNQAAGTRYTGVAEAIEGEQKKKASELAAAGTIAGTAGSMFKTYGSYAFPQSFRST